MLEFGLMHLAFEQTNLRSNTLYIIKRIQTNHQTLFDKNTAVWLIENFPELKMYFTLTRCSFKALDIILIGCRYKVLNKGWLLKGFVGDSMAGVERINVK